MWGLRKSFREHQKLFVAGKSLTDLGGIEFADGYVDVELCCPMAQQPGVRDDHEILAGDQPWQRQAELRTDPGGLSRGYNKWLNASHAGVPGRPP